MSTEPPLTDDEISAVAEQLKEHSGVYTRRDIIAAAAATGSLGVLGALGIDSAEASHGVGRAGEPGDPLEAVYANKIGDSSEPTESVVTESGRITDDTAITINVPTDFDTVAAAVDDVRKRFTPRGTNISINIESGHVWSQPVVIRSDFRNVTITSADAEVSVDSTSMDGQRALTVRDAVGPIWDILLNGDISGARNTAFGLLVDRNASLRVESGAGAKRWDHGLSISRNAAVHCETPGAEFTDNVRGVNVSRNSLAFVSQATISGNSTHNIRISAGKVFGATVDATNAGQVGLNMNDGVFVGSGLDVSGAGDKGIDVTDAYIHTDLTATNTTDIGALLQQSYGSLAGSTIDGAGNIGMSIQDGSRIDAHGIIVQNCSGTGVHAYNGVRANLENCDVNNNDGRGVQVRMGSTANLQGGNSSGNTLNDIEIRYGSIIAPDNCTTSSSTGSDPHENDMNKSPNTVHGEGVIFAESTEV